MTAESPNPSLLDRVWTHFAEHRRWPSAKRLRIEYANRKLDLQADAQAASLAVGSDFASAGFDALLHLPTVRELLAPLPTLLRHIADNYILHPSYLGESSDS